MNIIRVGKQEIVTPVVIISEADLKIVTPVDIILKGILKCHCALMSFSRGNCRSAYCTSLNSLQLSLSQTFHAFRIRFWHSWNILYDVKLQEESFRIGLELWFWQEVFKKSETRKFNNFRQFSIIDWTRKISKFPSHSWKIEIFPQSVFHAF